MQVILIQKNQVVIGSGKTILNIPLLKSGFYQVVYADGIEKKSSLLVVRYPQFVAFGKYHQP